MSSDMRTLRAFTLIEMIVVVLILGILTTLVTTSVTGLMNTSKGRSTRLMLETLAGAIEAFAEADPLGGAGQVLCDPGVEPDDSYRDVFGRYPPSPTAAFDLQAAPGTACGMTDEFDVNEG